MTTTTAVGIVQEVVANQCHDDYARMAIAFSGGKDCVALLHVMESAGVNLSRITCVYWQSDEAWPEVVEAVHAETARRQLSLLVLPLPPADTSADRYRLGLEALRQCMPRVECLFVGTRRTDPHGHSQFASGALQPTSPGWPPFLRCAPLLDWTTDDVWRLIRANALPVCSLYTTHGHSSLGDTRGEHRHDRDAAKV